MIKTIKNLTPFCLLALLVSGCVFSVNSFDDQIEGDGNVTKEKREIDDFTHIENHDVIDVTLTEAGNDLEVKADSNLLPHIKTEVNNATLTLATTESIGDYSSLHVSVPVKNLESLTNNGTGDIDSEITIEAKDFEIEANGTGDTELTVQCDSLSYDGLGTGDGKLKGEAKGMHVELTGTGDLDARELETHKVRTNLTGTGDCYIHVRDKLWVKSLGTGDVQYKGDPRIQEVSSTGTGDVEKIN